MAKYEVSCEMENLPPGMEVSTEYGKFNNQAGPLALELPDDDARAFGNTPGWKITPDPPAEDAPAEEPPQEPTEPSPQQANFAFKIESGETTATDNKIVDTTPTSTQGPEKVELPASTVVVEPSSQDTPPPAPQEGGEPA